MKTGKSLQELAAEVTPRAGRISLRTVHFLHTNKSHGWIELTEEECDAIADIACYNPSITGDEAAKAVLSITRPEL